MNGNKLLVLDLNHALLCRRNRTTIAAKNPTPRPYLATFLTYIFSSTDTQSAWSVFVWSSARPHNVQAMCRSIGLTPFAPLKGMWTRDNLGLSQEQYHQRVATIKNLDLLWKKFAPLYEAHNTVLLDNEEDKASKQPQNFLLIPEFDPHGSHWHNSKREAKDFESDNALLGVIGKLHKLAAVSNFSICIDNFQKMQKNIPDSDWGRSENEWVQEGEVVCQQMGIPISKEWDKYWPCTPFRLSREEVEDRILKN